MKQVFFILIVFFLSCNKDEKQVRDDSSRDGIYTVDDFNNDNRTGLNLPILARTSGVSYDLVKGIQEAHNLFTIDSIYPAFLNTDSRNFLGRNFSDAKVTIKYMDGSIYLDTLFVEIGNKAFKPNPVYSQISNGGVKMVSVTKTAKTQDWFDPLCGKFRKQPIYLVNGKTQILPNRTCTNAQFSYNLIF